MTEARVDGTTEERFAPAVEVFEQNFSAHSGVGAAFAVTLENEFVVDIWGGWTDADRVRPWAADTIVNCFSVTKGVTSLLLHLLADRGTIGLDQRVSEYWPEYAQQGKEETLVRDLLGHLAGLPWLRRRVGRRDLYDWDRFCRRLEAEAPIFPPVDTVRVPRAHVRPSCR